ncbi:hypothetical protein B9Z19DRAFT_1073464 [Tuber borchii]|uniref:Uncharacterized protein n=1 Tax=Tuber borchii TaxID=42251 RepID=A0A2T7A5U7_TUBBO|nr:hypothetical protein B9Z19DRAFT_1073464 [Tuber borchii]
MYVGSWQLASPCIFLSIPGCVSLIGDTGFEDKSADRFVLCGTSIISVVSIVVNITVLRVSSTPLPRYFHP